MASFAVYDKGGKAKVKCFAGCDDEMDVLPALGMRVADLYDRPRDLRDYSSFERTRMSAERLARAEARKTMTRRQLAVDDLLHMPGFAEKLCKTIGRVRPELYLIDKHDLELSNALESSDPGYRHIAHLFAEDAQLAEGAQDQKGGVASYV